MLIDVADLLWGFIFGGTFEIRFDDVSGMILLGDGAAKVFRSRKEEAKKTRMFSSLGERLKQSPESSQSESNDKEELTVRK